jgi:hypothetical protein
MYGHNGRPSKNIERHQINDDLQKCFMFFKKRTNIFVLFYFFEIGLGKKQHL